MTTISFLSIVYINKSTEKLLRLSEFHSAHTLWNSFGNNVCIQIIFNLKNDKKLRAEKIENCVITK